MSFLLNKAKEASKAVQDTASQAYTNAPTITGKFGLGTLVDGASNALGYTDPALKNRHDASSAVTSGNAAKFHVTGGAYFWAISEALEAAKSSIWIHGWWVSPEVYLRRPPALNEKYRLDRMLTDAAERGVQVNIIVYKEMPNTIHLESRHTKHHLEKCHKNIQVFRHPDWYASPKEAASGFSSLVQGAMKGTISADGLKNLADDQIEKAIALASLPIPGWTHHDKSCIVDGKIAFLGGIDIAYGRWDLIQHPIADVHGDDPKGIVYPGQDYNNGRIADFANLTNWEKNSLDRKKYSRMGWEDIAMSVTGPVAADIAAHFVHRWNFLYEKKYNTWTDSRYARITIEGGKEGVPPSTIPGSLITPAGDMECQFIRSCTRWSNGTPTEHSIYSAYIETIEQSEHFIYIENQFFVTKSAALPLTVWNRIGEAIAHRIVKAAKAGKKYKVFVVMPAVMIYPGELVDPRAFPARLTMKMNYHSINQGHLFSNIYSIIKHAGFEPTNHIRFYNLRTYDRINPSSSGPASISACYMSPPGGAPDIRAIPFSGSPEEELDAFVSEQLYVHSKLLIADDRIVICGSANLNDRSMKGSRDSEMGIWISDPTTLDATMDGKPYKASKFAATMRRYLFRKHLGLLAPQDMQNPDGNFHPSPVPNDYDLGSEWDAKVADPLSEEFLELWQGTAKRNGAAFWKVFEPVPDNSIKTWVGYTAQALKRNTKSSHWGHVIKSNFSAGEAGVREVKEVLATIRGMLIEMPMEFLSHDDMELLMWNPLTQVVSA